MSRLETLLKEAQGILDGNQDPAEALSRAQDAMVLSPANPDVWLMMGNAYRSMERFADAMDCYSSAMKHAGDRTEVIALARGGVYARTGKIPDAMDEYLSVLSTNPSSVPARTGLAMCLSDAGELDKAIAEFETAIQDGNGASWFKRDVEKCYDGLSQAFWKKGKWWKAMHTNLKGFWFSLSHLLGDLYFP